MKRWLFTFLLFPGLLFAQIDPKYGEGAVPVVNGKVVFARSLDMPDWSGEQIYQAVKAWADTFFVPTKEFQRQILIADPEKGQLLAQGQQYLVFTDKTFSLDRALVSYQLLVTCSTGKCELKMRGIRYLYQTGGVKPETILAEEQIVDKYTMNKAKTKLIRATGKFRTRTIDLAGQIFDEVASVCGGQKVGAAAEKTVGLPPPVPAREGRDLQTSPSLPSAQPADLPAAPAAAVPWAGYKQIAPQQIPGNIIRMLADDGMLITAGEGGQFDMMTAGWGGLGRLYGKPVAFCFIHPSRYTCQLMEKNDTYTLSFYTAAYREALEYCGSHTGREEDKVKGAGLTPLATPSGAQTFAEAWMIIECRKLVAQSFVPEAIFSDAVREKWADRQLHKMYIGEILNVWVK